MKTVVADAKGVLREIEGKMMFRAATVNRAAVDQEARTVELAFSSEAPFERWFGMEILDHGKKSVRLDSYMRNGAAVLVNHEEEDQVGVVETVEISNDRRGRATVRFGESKRADEIFRDIATGIRRHVSVAYQVHKMVLEEEKDGSPSIYRVLDWEPFEVSIVPVPADTSVGVGRSAFAKEYPTEVPEKEVRKMETNGIKEAIPDVKVVDTRGIEAAAAKKAGNAEKERIRSITAIGERHGMGDLAKEYVDGDRSIDEFRAAALEKMGAIVPVSESPEIGLTSRETDQFSFIRAINAMANPNSVKAREAAAFEMECSQAVAEKLRRSPQGVFVPQEALNRQMTVGVNADGGYMVGTDLKGESFVEVLRNRMLTLQMGATEMNGLVGDCAIPKQTGQHTMYWVAEDGAPTESKAALAQLSLSPKTAGAFDDISRKLLQQATPDAEAFVRDDIAKVLAIGKDLAALHGSGASNQPTGIASTTGVGSVAGGTNGAAPTNGNIIALETAIAAANADFATCGYLTNAKVRGKLRQTYPNGAGGDTALWRDGNEPGFGMLNGYKAGVTNQASSTLTKGTASGVCSAIFFGDWANLIIASWGTLDLLVDPYSLSTTGAVRVVAFESVDIAVRQAAAFAVMLDTLT